MMQNNPMGAMMPQGVAPAASTGLNFQSDPSMRAQFKGFMSGMQAKQPAPAAPMMQQPLPMPSPMQNIDIFQPSMPMQMAMGGSVPRSTQIAGQPHMLSYITPGEANVLQSMGGSGAPGPGGIPSFFFDTAEFGAGGGGYSDPYESPGTAGTTNFTSGGVDNSLEFGGSGDGNRYDSSGNTVNFSTTTTPGAGAGMDSPEVYARDALSNLMAREAARIDAQDITARGGVPEIEEGFGPTSKVIGMSQQPMEAEFANLGGAGTGAASNVQAISNIADVLGENARAQSNLLDTVFDSDDYMSTPDTVFDVDTTFTGPIGVPDAIREQRAQLQARQQASPDVQAMQNLVSSVNIATPTSRPDGLGFGSIAVEEANPAAFGRGGRQAPELGFDLGGMGAEGEAVPSSAVQQAIDEARAKGGDTTTVELGPKGSYSTQFEQVRDIPGYDPNAEVPGIFTTAKGNAAMDKLLDRAQNFKESGIGGFLNKITGGRANFANRMASDIINKGYTPIFDRAGNIVATRNPETGQLGAGSVEARIPGMAGTGGGGGAPQMSVADQVAAALKRLGIGEDDEGEKAPPMINRPPEAGPGDPITFPVNQPTEAAQVANPLKFGYGQISGLTPNLNSAADDFLKLLGGGR